MSILVLTTGGTIGAMPFADPVKPPAFITVPPDNRDLVCEFFKNSGAAEIRCINAGHRDSKLIDDTYRANLQQLIETAAEDRILITHGTDTLLQSVDFFYGKREASAALARKTILMTGAMTPLANGPESDGYLNLNFSLERLTQNHLEGGIYIVLCDYGDAETRSNWGPRLYSYRPGQYEKFYDPEDGRRHRIKAISR